MQGNGFLFKNELMHFIKDKLEMFNKNKMDKQYEKKHLMKKKLIVQISISSSIQYIPKHMNAFMTKNRYFNIKH